MPFFRVNLCSSILTLAIGCVLQPATAQAITGSPTFQMQFDHSKLDSKNGPSFLDDRLRRLQLGFEGGINKSVKYKVEFDLDDDGDQSWTSVYLDFPISENLTLRLGHDKTPNSLEEQTSSRSVAFSERASFTDAFSFERALGATIRGSFDDIQVSIGAFADNINDNAFSGTYSLAGRVGRTTQIDGGTVYFGASARYRNAHQHEFEYAARFQSPAPFDLLESDIDASQDLFVGTEFGFTSANLWTTAELGYLASECNCQRSDSFGGYLSAGVVFGGTRTLSAGKLSSPTIRQTVDAGGAGAFGVSARYDHLRLAQANSEREDAQTLNLSLDWWLNENLRFALTAYRSRASYSNQFAGITIPFREATGIAFRHQISF